MKSVWMHWNKQANPQKALTNRAYTSSHEKTWAQVLISTQTGLLTNNHNSQLCNMGWIQWLSSPSKAGHDTQNKDDQGLEVRLWSFSQLWQWTYFLGSNLTTFSISTLFFFTYKMGFRAEKNYCTSKVARKNRTNTVQDICTSSNVILHIYKANHFTSKRKKAILDEHFSAQHI